MKYSNERLNRRQKKSLLKTFLVASGITLCICGIVLGLGLLMFDNTIGSQIQSQITPTELTEEEQAFEEEKEVLNGINKTVAVFGVDADGIRTDVILAVNFNSATGKVKVVSIPRDTKVIWSERQKRAYTELTGYAISVSKLNEMAAYGRINQNIGNIRDFTIDEMENILRVKIDNYVVINLDAFKEIVDAIGGVEVDVPHAMHYDDYAQGLHIHLEPGLQHLDSHDAEGLVRFRQYIQGDQQRVVVQQLFLKAVAEKVLSSEMIMQLPTIVSKLFPHIKTDIRLTEVLEYLGLLNSFDLSDLKFYTVPGYGDNSEGPSYYYIDEGALDEMIRQVFYSTEEEELELHQEEEGLEEMEEPIAIDKSVEIEIYNGAGIKGLATQYKDRLMTLGYDVIRFDNYKENNIERSIIYTREEAKAFQFLDYVTDAMIIEDQSIASDIMIVLGKDALR